MGGLVAIEAYMPYLRYGDKGQKAVHHSEPGPEYRHYGEFAAGDLHCFHRTYRSLNFNVFQRQVAGDFVAHQQGDFLEEFAEILASGLLHTHNGQLVLNHRMVDYVQLTHIGITFL